MRHHSNARLAVFARRLIVGALIIGSAASCASGSGGTDMTKPSTTTSPAASTTAPIDTLVPPTIVDADSVTVRSLDNDFEPRHVQIRAGTTVEFRQLGHNKHNIIPDDPSVADFSVGEDDFPLGATSRFTFTRPGTYPYYCSLHATPTAGSMRGVITVTR